MKKTLLIIIIFISSLFSDSKSIMQNQNVPKRDRMLIGIDIGMFVQEVLYLNYGGLYLYDRAKIFNPLCGIMLIGGLGENIEKYEDYTSELGTVNVFDDREDGLIMRSKGQGFAGIGRLLINKKEFIFHYGLIKYEKLYYQGLYDPLEILGNNGYYYIDSDKPNDKGIGYVYGLGYRFNIPLKDGVGVVKLGIGVHFNTISDLPKGLVKMDLGFTLGNNNY